MEKTAYGLAERAQRGSVEAYARLLDQLGGGAERVPIALFTSEAANGRLIAIVPVAPSDLDAADVRWRLGACLFDAAERVAREVSATVTAGAVCGSLAVELRPWAVEAELFQVALEEAWEARPSLAAAGLTMASEVIFDHEPPFESISLEEPLAPAGIAHNDVRGVARRLGLSLADLIASLSASGLPVHDDLAEEGVEDSLRELLQGPSHEEPAKRASAAGSPAPASEGASSSARVIASRLLAKLVRDRRFGARSTNEASVWGHHFADDEKAPARELVRRLKRMGVFQSKSGEAISIDPRRMEEVQRIIAMRWEDPGLFEGLE